MTEPPGAVAGGRPLFVLVHSPLVGPATWRPCADVLRALGYPVAVPSLLATLRDGPPYESRQVEAVVDSVAAAVGGGGSDGGGSGGAASDGAASVGAGCVLVGHSRAGALLPAVGAAVGAAIGPVTRAVGGGGVSAYVFVDAAPPRPGRSWWDTAPATSIAMVEGMARDGWVPPWSEWFGEDSMRTQVPGARVRETVLADLGPLPLAMFREPAAEVPGWPDAPCSYLRLSVAYEGHRAEAEAKGWPTGTLDLTHLGICTEPAAVVRAILGLLAP